MGEGPTRRQKGFGVATARVLQPWMQRGFARHSAALASGKPNATKGDAQVPYSSEQHLSSVQGKSAAFRRASIFPSP